MNLPWKSDFFHSVVCSNLQPQWWHTGMNKGVLSRIQDPEAFAAATTGSHSHSERIVSRWQWGVWGKAQAKVRSNCKSPGGCARFTSHSKYRWHRQSRWIQIHRSFGRSARFSAHTCHFQISCADNRWLVVKWGHYLSVRAPYAMNVGDCWNSSLTWVSLCVGCTHEHSIGSW